MPATNQYANAAKKATNVSLAEALLTEAKELRQGNRTDFA